jgi:hypothetical protein
MTIEAVGQAMPDGNTRQPPAPAVDQRLVNLAASAERELPCPSILNLLVGSWLVQGQPVSSRQFLEATEGSLQESLAQTSEARRFRGTAEQKQQIIREATDPMMSSLRTAEDGPLSLNLVNVTIAGSVGPSLHPPAVRIPLPAVGAWWITDFAIKNGGGGGGGGVSVGFSF